MASTLLLNILSVLNSDKLASEALINILKRECMVTVTKLFETHFNNEFIYGADVHDIFSSPL